MYDILHGVKVVEVSQYALVPAAGAVLAEWGAEVVKVVHPRIADPMRTAGAGGLAPTDDGTAYVWEIVNRGKRSIGIDLATEPGRALLDELVRDADVFLTNLLPAARRRLRIDVDDIVPAHPRIVYGRGSAHGSRGPQSEAGGFDSATFWARSGWAHPASQAAGQFVAQPGPAVGDLTAGFALASGVVGALYRRERTGAGGVVDVSLMSAGMWGMGASITASELYDVDAPPGRDRTRPGNALFAGYETKDRRYLFLAAMRHDAGFEELVHALGRDDLAADSRFATPEARLHHHGELVDALAETFAAKTLDECRAALNAISMPWGVAQTPRELHSDPQVVANGYIQDVDRPGRRTLRLTAGPVQFDERAPSLSPAPELGQHTEEILLELGKDWDDIVRLKDQGAIT